MKKFLTTLAVLAVFATPAFAHSFDPDNGTGNVLAFSHTPTSPQNGKTALSAGALRAYASVPRFSSAVDPNSPASTGGGSLGYNEMLRIY
jgi:hypothetical protein